jgi:hypothetical protein
MNKEFWLHTGASMTPICRVTARLPKVDLSDLLIEVDRWTGFTGAWPAPLEVVRRL